MTDREALYETHQNLPIACVKAYCDGKVDDDLLQVSRIAMWEAAGKFDPTRGVKFKTYAWNLMIGAMKKERRDRGELIKTPSWKQEKGEYVEQPVSIDHIPECYHPGRKDEYPAFVLDFLRKKCKGHKAAEYIIMRSEGYSLKDIAKIEGTTVAAVSDLIIRFQKRLRRNPEVCEFFGRGEEE